MQHEKWKIKTKACSGQSGNPQGELWSISWVDAKYKAFDLRKRKVVIPLISNVSRSA